ncbi:MAG: Sm ribonucleo-like protein [Acidobacteria bacterium]|nr:Sm ribonucleo-like protein [Acidobacteriota bacterium]
MSPPPPPPPPPPPAVDKAKKGKARAPEQTFEEVKYLRQLIDQHQVVRVRLLDNEEVTGVIEYYDHNFIRLTREGAPNLFIFKHDIKYIAETAKA